MTDIQIGSWSFLHNSVDIWFSLVVPPFLAWLLSRAFDWLVGSSNRILLMVIGSCFSQFTPSSGVMSFLCVISFGNFVISPLYSISPHTFPRSLISFCSHLDIFLLVLGCLFDCIVPGNSAWSWPEIRCQLWSFGISRCFASWFHLGRSCPAVFGWFVLFVGFLRVRFLLLHHRCMLLDVVYFFSRVLGIAAAYSCPNLCHLFHAAVFAGHLWSGVKICCPQNPQSFLFCGRFPVKVLLFVR